VYDVVVVGSANLDLVASTPRLPEPGETLLGTGFAEHAGGKGLNQAVAAARCGARVAIVGAVGDDDAGRSLASIADSEGVATGQLVTIDEVPTGRAVITVDSQAENTIVVIAGANDRVVVEQLPVASVVIAQLEIPIDQVIAAFRIARRNGGRTILNPAPARELPDELVELCDIVVPNEHELALIGDVPFLLDRGVTAIITTLGGAGVAVSCARDGGGPPEDWSQQPFPVTPVDTTGAGDAFCGALAARLAAGDDLRTAVRFAAAAGALATTTPGAVPSLPRYEDVATLLAHSPPAP